jgi:anti-sigma B factor antagonist
VSGPSPRSGGVLALQVASSKGHSTVELQGEIDGYSAPKLRHCLRELTDAGQRRIVLDFTGIESIDSAGLGVLIGASRCLSQRRGELVVTSPRRQAAKLLEMTRLDTIVTVQKQP